MKIVKITKNKYKDKNRIRVILKIIVLHKYKDLWYSIEYLISLLLFDFSIVTINNLQMSKRKTYI